MYGLRRPCYTADTKGMGCSPICDAIAARDLERVRQLLAADPALANTSCELDVPGANFSGMQLLAPALPQSQQQPAVPRKSRTVLQLAVQYSTPGIVRELLQFGADVHAGDETIGNSLLHDAAWRGDEPVAMTKALISGGADVNARSKNGTVLHSAIQAFNRKDPAIVKELVELLLENGADVHARCTSSGWTALDHATFRSRTDDWSPVFRALLRGGANVNAAAPERGQTGTLLFRAAQGRTPTILQLLIEAGADVNAPTQRWGTPLHTAARRGLDVNIEHLLAAGADPCAVDGENRTPLDLLKGHEEMLAFLDGEGA